MTRKSSYSALAVITMVAVMTLTTAFSFVAVALPQNAPPMVQKLLTFADVESITGVKGVKLVPKNPSKGQTGISILPSPTALFS